MARTFSKQDARRVHQFHTELLNNLQYVINKPEEYKSKIRNSVDVMVSQELIDVLNGIPVDELNRNGAGLRIKNLKDAGFKTINDIYVAQKYRIASVKGISEYGASVAKNIAYEYANKAKKGIRIKLNIDSKTIASTMLAKEIFKYKYGTNVSREASRLYNDCSGQVIEALRNLEPSTGAIKWFFTSSQNKQAAEKAYTTLETIINGYFGTKGRELCNQLNQIDSIDDATVWNDFQNYSISYFTILEEVYPGILGQSDDVYGLPEELAKEIGQERYHLDGLNCTLRRYQEWGVRYILHQGRVLLGDEMGLGKTVQAIAAMVSLRNLGASHFVVVCPASVVANWCREINKHSTLSVIKVHGSGRLYALKSWVSKGGVAVTTYETTSHFELDPDFRFDMVVVDEAHYIKNPSAARTRNVKALCTHTDRMLFMTGTALENRVDEMIGLIGILQPNIAASVKNLAFMSNAPQFRNMVAPVYYRRKRDQVLAELPDLIENKEWCSMNAHEEEAYIRTLYSRNLMAVRRVSWNVDDLNYSTKANRLKEIVEDAKDDDRKVIVFSFFLDTLSSVCKVLGDACLEPINGSVPPARRQEIIDRFDNAPAGSVLPAQILSGGTGLNIQAASVVVICEPQYKPSIENQAISRAYRMGQVRNVIVYRLLSDNTVDERILDILDRKQAEFNAFADKSVAGEESIALDDGTMGDIINSEIERIKRSNIKL